MYLVTLFDDQPVIEASLGGHVDVVEMKLFSEEVALLFHDLGNTPFYLLLDYSKTAGFDEKTTEALNALKDKAFRAGAVKIYSVPQEDTEVEEHLSGRMQFVLEGREEFIVQAHLAKFPPLPHQIDKRAA
jgi:hypothetical protein